jgi:ribosomal protein S18 acetylase RimI-like enzyme
MNDLVCVEFRTELAGELVRLWRASFEDGVGLADPHPFEEQRRYLLEDVVPRFSVRVALLAGDLVGFIAANDRAISQLYVRVGFHRRGIGSRLLDWAKAQSSGELWLYTFARNKRACAFYEKNGFRAVAKGFEPNWKLEDVKYAWTLDGPDRTPPATSFGTAAKVPQAKSEREQHAEVHDESACDQRGEQRDAQSPL